MDNKKLSDLANKLEEKYGRDGVTFTAEDYEKVKHPELPKHDAKQAMQQYIKAMHDTEGIDWDKVIASGSTSSIPMPVDGGYEDSDNSRVRGSGTACRADEGFDDLGYDSF